MKKVLFLFVAFLAMQVGAFTAQAQLYVPVEGSAGYVVYGVNSNGETQLTLNGGYAGKGFSVTGLTSGQTADWSLETYGADGTFYIWPYSGNTGAEVSIYSSTSGVIRVILQIYNGSTLFKFIPLYIYYQ